MHKEDGADLRTIIKKELPSSGASDRDIRKKKKKKKKGKGKINSTSRVWESVS